MSSDPPDAEPRARWTEEDRALLRTLGGRISQLIHGEEVDLPDLQRRDELGILANMLSRLARDLSAARRRDLAYHSELEKRVAQLQSAYFTQEKLLGTIRELSSPILEPYEGILLLPLVGALDAARVASVLPTLLDRIAKDRPRVVILHVTHGGHDGNHDGARPAGCGPMPGEPATLLLRAEQSARHFGTRMILSGVAHATAAAAAVAPEAGIDLSAFTPCADLQEALATALDFVGHRITR